MLCLGLTVPGIGFMHDTMGIYTIRRQPFHVKDQGGGSVTARDCPTGRRTILLGTNSSPAEATNVHNRDKTKWLLVTSAPKEANVCCLRPADKGLVYKRKSEAIFRERAVITYSVRDDD